jgi:electron transport complex protein RnfB
LTIKNTLRTPDLYLQLDALLPQTQCTKCGFPDCQSYARAMAEGLAEHNRCPPGGVEGISRLAKHLKKPILPLDESHGVERPRPLAVINPKECIGCTLCIQACPVDAIVGAAKQLHIVINELCTGCDLCVPPCPVDCIAMIPVTGSKTGWDAWSNEQAQTAKTHYEKRNLRLIREEKDLLKRQTAKASAKLKKVSSSTLKNDESENARKKAIIEAAMARAKQRLDELGPK